MTEVTTYPHVLRHHLGGSTRRLIAPAPEHPPVFFSPDLFRDISASLAPMDYHSHYGLPRTTSAADRSMSVSSAASSVSHHAPFTSDSRTLSPASIVSEPPSSMVARSHHQQSLSHQHQPSYGSHAPISSYFPDSSQYFHSQINSQLPLYVPIPPAPRTFGHQSPYSFQMNTLPPQPSMPSLQSYASIYPVYSTTHAGYYQPSPEATEKERKENIAYLQILQKLYEFPPEVVRLIGIHLGYLYTRRMVTMNRFYRSSFPASIYNDEEKLAGVMEAERSLPRYFIREAKGPREDEGKGQTPQEAQDSGLNITPRDSFACCHCFRMRAPENFERCKWAYRADDEDDGGGANTTGGGNDSNDTDSTTTTTTTAVTITHNPYYAPNLTGESLKGQATARATARAAARNNNRSNTPTTATTSSSSSTTIAFRGGTSFSTPSLLLPVDNNNNNRPRWAWRRFCVDCGVRNEFYKPRDLIELHGPRGLAKWICNCKPRRVHQRPTELHCNGCGDDTPFIPPGGRRGRG